MTRRKQRLEAWWEYLLGAMWVLPITAMVLSIALGAALSLVDIPESSSYHWLVFQGSPDDARSLLIGIAGTTITVIALMLGLTVVALQLSSTQYSPRIVRNFLRDRPNQIVLSVFVATFAYSAAGLYTVGVSAGRDTESFPRAAVSGAIGLLFLSLGALVYEVHHISHSMQIDEIMRRIGRNTTAVIHNRLTHGDDDAEVVPIPPADAIAIAAVHSGYVQTLHPDAAIDYAAGHSIHIRYAMPVGAHIVRGSPLAWVWSDTGAEVDADRCAVLIAECVRVGFERTLEQDVPFGIRQLVDVAAKALSPAVNDPYTGVQVIDQLATILAILATRRLGPTVHRPTPSATVTTPARDFEGYLDLACGQIRRYGATEPAVALALIEMLSSVASCLGPESASRRAALVTQLDLILDDAHRNIAQPADLEPVVRHAEKLKKLLER
ncbi:DUF2254 domain-containing protein, partial [Nocardia sp. 348MFTsu5.1]|uniref:DUF2254 domain-containing protein n=1 Tax=Nocardia sp. 348MFTsu5.1 TaxID=1172185 RepID=UPI0003A91DD3